MALSLLGGLGGGLLGGLVGKQFGGGSGNKWATALGGLAGAGLGAYGAGGGFSGEGMSGAAVDPNAPKEATGLFGNTDFSQLKDIGAGLTGAGNVYSTITGAQQSQDLIDLQKQAYQNSLLGQRREQDRQKQAETNMGAGFGNYYYA